MNKIERYRQRAKRNKHLNGQVFIGMWVPYKSAKHARKLAACTDQNIGTVFAQAFVRGLK